MKRLTVLIFIAGIFLKAAGQNATEIVSKADKKMRGTTMEAEMVIRTIRPTWTDTVQNLDKREQPGHDTHYGTRKKQRRSVSEKEKRSMDLGSFARTYCEASAFDDGQNWNHFFK